MSGSTICYQRPVARCTDALASLLKRFDMRALAVIMFVALAPLADRSLLRDLERVFHVKTLLSPSASRE